jgi:polyhydroxybutyrate depolymerase
MACEHGDRVAAVAPIAGARVIDGCEFSRPVPVVAFHGTADGYVAYDGGLGEAALDLPAPDGSGRTLRDLATSEDLAAGRGSDSVPTIMEAWAERNGCRTATTERVVTPEVTEIAFRCPADASTVLYRIAGGGHTWPGSGFSDSIASIVGPTNMDVSANEIMWSFFQDHPLRTG